ncbi:MAG: lamin tail domain-containing protein [Chloroflexi bacterium]|nr:lamin tail domain-containing protein [Chloroflexota bacterium]
MRTRTLPRWTVRQALFVLVAGIVLGIAGSTPSETQALSTNIVISQVYGGGGGSGYYLYDYVELFNLGTSAASLTGWSLQYGSATGNFGSSSSNIYAFPAGTTIQPGRYLLVQLGSAGSSGANLPVTPDLITTNLSMSQASGKVALASITSALGCGATATPCALPNANIVDLVSYGAANNAEGGATINNNTALTNQQGGVRKSNGCQETDNNNSDFNVLSGVALVARNSSSASNVCSGGITLSINDVTVTEGNSGTTTATFTVSLSAPAGAGGVTFDLATADNTATTANNDYVARTLTGQTIPSGSSSYTFSVMVNGDTTAESNETFFVNVTSVVGATLADGQGTGTINNDDVVITTRIRDIQGSVHISPLNGTAVTNIPGIVTALRATGFYMQDDTPDANDATSEGIFVFTSSAPTVSVGASVLVNGTVTEYRAGANGLTLTEITSPSVTTLSTGNTLPAAIVIGSGGRVPPTTVINDDGTGNIESSGTFDVATDGIDFYESLEGMRVQINNAVVVGPRVEYTGTTPNREIPVIGDNGASASIRTTRGGIVIRSSDYNPERIILNDLITGVSPLPVANVGDSFATVVGVIDYNFDNYKLQVTTLPTLVSGGLAQETTTAQTGSQFSIATFNVENLDPNDGAAKFAGLAALIVTNLRSPDIIAVEEVQDNNGATNDAVVTANTTWSTLINAIATAGGPTYQYRDINPVDDQDGGEPGGNIRQGFLFRTDRGLAFVDRAGGTSTATTTVNNVGGVPQLSYSPGRIDPSNAAFSASRKPLAGEFTFGGATLFVIANHWNSKGGDMPLYGYTQPPTLTSESQRVQQATVVRDFVLNILAIDANARVVVLGDLNDFEFSTPLTTIKNSGMMSDMLEVLAQNERYSYIYQGNSQALEHILVTSALASRRQRVDVVHVNAEFVTRWSDHDPMVAVFDLSAPTAVTLSQFDAHANDARVSVVVLFALVGAGASIIAWLSERGRKPSP